MVGYNNYIVINRPTTQVLRVKKDDEVAEIILYNQVLLISLNLKDTHLMKR